MNTQIARIKKIIETYTNGYSLKVLDEPIGEEVTDPSIYESDILLEFGDGSGWRYEWEAPVSYITIWFHKYIRKERFDELVRVLSEIEKVVSAVHNHVSRWFHINIMIEREYKIWSVIENDKGA